MTSLWLNTFSWKLLKIWPWIRYVFFREHLLTWPLVDCVPHSARGWQNAGNCLTKKRDKWVKKKAAAANFINGIRRYNVNHRLLDKLKANPIHKVKLNKLNRNITNRPRFIVQNDPVLRICERCVILQDSQITCRWYENAISRRDGRALSLTANNRNTPLNHSTNPQSLGQSTNRGKNAAIGRLQQLSCSHSLVASSNPLSLWLKLMFRISRPLKNKMSVWGNGEGRAVALLKERAHLQFAKVHVLEPEGFWENVLWIDETKIELRDVLCWKKKNLINPEKCYGGRIIVWGLFCCACARTARLHWWNNEFWPVKVDSEAKTSIH